jgi:hypothetical protein
VNSDPPDTDPKPRRSAWKGTWKGAQQSGEMRCTLTFHPGGKVLGAGADRLGAYRIEGRLDGDAITFIKQYAQHFVDYAGTLDEAAGTMRGAWSIGVTRVTESGTFLLKRV